MVTTMTKETAAQQVEDVLGRGKPGADRELLLAAKAAIEQNVQRTYALGKKGPEQENVSSIRNSR